MSLFVCLCEEGVTNERVGREGGRTEGETEGLSVFEEASSLMVWLAAAW